MLPNSGGFAATFLSTVVIFISLSTVISVALYVLWPFRPDELFPRDDIPCKPMEWPWIPCWWENWKSILAPIAGALVAVVAGCLFALVRGNRTRADEVNPEVYGDLRARVETVSMLVPALCPGSGVAECSHSAQSACCAACAEARARLDFIKSELSSHGSRWVLGTGYVDLYRQVHAIESALLLVQPASEVVAAGSYDALRLDGANKLPNRQGLQDNIVRALPLVGGPSIQLGTPGTPDSAAAPQASSTAPTSDQQALGRALLRDVRQSISEFRDGERASLVRARNQLVWTGVFTSVAGYVLMVLAMLRGVRPELVSTGFVYYVVGATVGLFNQLRTDSTPRGSEEDFGFRRARLFYTPVLSGLAAVGGVMVIALLYDTVDFGAVETADRTLGDIYDVQKFQLGLVIAAVFGLTPDLLVNHLQRKADEYRSGLASTTPVSNGTTAKG
jgi:hypothetical protein